MISFDPHLNWINNKRVCIAAIDLGYRIINERITIKPLQFYLSESEWKRAKRRYTGGYKTFWQLLFYDYYEFFFLRHWSLQAYIKYSLNCNIDIHIWLFVCGSHDSLTTNKLKHTKCETHWNRYTHHFKRTINYVNICLLLSPNIVNGNSDCVI